jgi:hypothetical protein
MQLKVEKSDGSSEVYLHTKVLGTIAAAMSASGSYQEGEPELLAEAVTTFLRRRYGNVSVSSDEVHSMIEVVLSATDFEDAAQALQEHRVNRHIRRRRLEVIRRDKTAHRGILVKDDYSIEDQTAQPWNKSAIVWELERERALPHNLARAVAGSVEEKALLLGCRRVTSTLVRELVANELLAMRQAEKALAEQSEGEKNKLVGKAKGKTAWSSAREAVAAESSGY